MKKLFYNQNTAVHHPPFTVELKCGDIKFLKSNKTEKLNFYRANYDEINAKLQNTNWGGLLQNKEINEAVDIFYQRIYEIIHEFTPVIKPKPDDFPKWFSSSLISMIKDKEYYRKKMQRTNGEMFKELFIAKRKEIKKEKRKCLKKYVNNIEPMIQSNPKSFFAYTKAQKQSNKLPPAMVYGSKQADNMKETVNLFAEYFSSVHEDHNGEIEIPNTSDAYDFETDLDIIEKVISSIDSSKTNSPDGIPGMFYKNTINQIKFPLRILFDLSIKSMKYPDKWKLSYISPIFKSGDNTNVTNYRPISVLSAIAKIYDKIIYFYIRDKTLHLLSRFQHGFRGGKSALTNLLEFVDYITQHMMKGSQVDAIFMDLAKAFDKIDHSILLKKLLTFRLHPNLVGPFNQIIS